MGFNFFVLGYITKSMVLVSPSVKICDFLLLLFLFFFQYWRVGEAREREKKNKNKKRLLGPMAAPGILFRGSLRNLNFKLLHESSLLVFIANVGSSYDHFILLSLSNIFIFI